MPIKSRDDLSMAYTPGVGRICMAIHDDPATVWNLTVKGNTVAVVTDGTAVLGLGDIGPEAAMPVMEGKAMLFKEFGGVDAWPICLDTKDVDEIVAIVKAIAPGFGGINLEDIAAPRCFEIEQRLHAELDIPVFHDDQHGTAVVVLAALINALKLVGKRTARRPRRDGRRRRGRHRGRQHAGRRTACRTSSAATARARSTRGREGLDAAAACSPSARTRASFAGTIARGAGRRRRRHRPVRPGHDPGRRRPDDGRRAIVFAMANPTPEVQPEDVRDDVAVIATGRSDYPNQINNVLAFPGIFRGALDVRARTMNEEMKLAAAEAIASVIRRGRAARRLHHPERLQPRARRRVAAAVAEAAVATGVARRGSRRPPDGETRPKAAEARTSTVASSGSTTSRSRAVGGSKPAATASASRTAAAATAGWAAPRTARTIRQPSAVRCASSTIGGANSAVEVRPSVIDSHDTGGARRRASNLRKATSSCLAGRNGPSCAICLRRSLARRGSRRTSSARCSRSVWS